MTSFNSPETAYYFERFGFCDQLIDLAPVPDLGMVVVIPCFNEPNLYAALESLWRCDRPLCAVEVIVVINSASTAAREILHQNLVTLREGLDWEAEHREDRFRFFFLHCPGLPPKKAGVGLARKIGMDEALRRFDHVPRPEGVILCFDADCTCDSDYLVEIDRFFIDRPQTPGCSVYFEHPLEGPEDLEIYEAVTVYELHLRYYVEALRYAGFPHAFHTIGSSMAVRAAAYQKEGGMNKRQAGEDFYFLHKIIPLGDFGEVNRTRVIPRDRASHQSLMSVLVNAHLRFSLI